MFATVSTWRLTSPPESVAGWDRFVRTLVDRGIQQAREMNVADMIVVAVEPDQIMVVCEFETLAEAEAAEPATLAFANEAYAQEAELVERGRGPLYEVRRFAQLDFPQDRGESGSKAGMFAQVVWWTLASEVQHPQALDNFLGSAWGTAAPILREVGLYDIVGVQVRPDMLVSFRMYSASTLVDHAFRAATERARTVLAGGAVSSAETIGRAWDTQILLDFLT